MIFNPLEALFIPSVLFFLIGFLAPLLRIKVAFPDSVAKVLALYLLISIGMQGGVTLSNEPLSWDLAGVWGAGILMGGVLCLTAFFLFKRRVSLEESASLAASFGSVSVVTFFAAIAFLESMGLSHSGRMIPLVAIMETPPIIIALMLYAKFGKKETLKCGEIVKDALANPSVYILIASFVVGLVSGQKGWEQVRPFTHEMFKGVLMLYLLDLGMKAAVSLADVPKEGRRYLVKMGIVFPLVSGTVGVVIARLLGLGAEDGLLFATLLAGASYIAVPAAMRLAMPEANLAAMIAIPLGVTFPTNLILGINWYWILMSLE